MKTIKSQFKILQERNLADWFSVIGVIPFFISIYCINIKEPELALIAGIASFVFDSLDGVIARKLKKVTDFGRQIDSFMDAMIYLVFPGYFVLIFMNAYLPLTLFCVGLVLAFGIFRLIRFNEIGFVQNKKGQISYPGLGTAYVFPVIVSLYLINRLLDYRIIYFIPIILITMSLAMVSEVPVRKPRLWFWYPLATLYLIILFNLRF